MHCQLTILQLSNAKHKFERAFDGHMRGSERDVTAISVHADMSCQSDFVTLQNYTLKILDASKFVIMHVVTYIFTIYLHCLLLKRRIVTKCRKTRVIFLCTIILSMPLVVPAVYDLYSNSMFKEIPSRLYNTLLHIHK